MAAKLDCAPSVQPTLCLKVGSVSLFRPVKAAKKNAFFGDVDNCSPTTPGLVPVDAKKAAATVYIGNPQVLHVCGWRDIAQILYTVVVGVAVLVINFAARPSSMEEQPCEAMRKVQLPIYGDETVAIAVDASSGPVLRRSLAFTKPSEFAGPWAVIKKIAQALRGKIGLSHDAVLSQIGQRLAGVSAHGGLRYFNLEQA